MRSGAAENSTRWRTTALPGNCLRFSDGLIPVLTFIYSWWFNQMLDFHCCQTAPPPPAAATQTSLYLNLSTALEDKRSPPPKNHSLFPTPYRLLQCQIYVVCLEQGTYYGSYFFEQKRDVWKIIGCCAGSVIKTTGPAMKMSKSDEPQFVSQCGLMKTKGEKKEIWQRSSDVRCRQSLNGINGSLAAKKFPFPRRGLRIKWLKYGQLLYDSTKDRFAGDSQSLVNALVQNSI